ncbi:nitrate- and nitrite sensing domain-containing protein [Saccharopolyspora sp. K220]|uniref:nitrate- and nitrite sensing domain-containing protein n=1 Tax=Saccharopolyspora soli TaxID=2926618 RepID=UPI001F5A9E88|nr:nitrate- and nitrite sensing domain-containing protein [Saccharopolyspora soli]MCI2419454.1 nitrate- and nitrite sensing domain-containing protein [Saccharopolyspora soli]
MSICSLTAHNGGSKIRRRLWCARACGFRRRRSSIRVGSSARVLRCPLTNGEGSETRSMSTLKRLLASGTIQARLLTIALVPSVAALLVGVGLSGYLIFQGLNVHGYAGKLAAAAEPSGRFVVDIQDERQLTLLLLSDRAQNRTQLDDARRETDIALSEMDTIAEGLADASPDEAAATIEEFRGQLAAVREVRKQVDSGPGDLNAVYGFYNGLVDSLNMSMRAYARAAPDSTVAYEQLMAVDLLDAADSMARGHALAMARTTSGMTQEQYHEYIHQIGAFHDNLNSLVPRMTPTEQQHYKDIQKGPAWQRIDGVQDALEAAGSQANSGQIIRLPVSTRDWQSSAHDLAGQLNSLSGEHSGYAASIGASMARATLITSLVTGSLIVVIALVVFLVALRLSHRLVRRLTRLRDETLAMSEQELPNVVARLRAGTQVDVENEVPWLSHGNDEIGQVANAFNQAQRTAIAATVQEAETRHGVRSVFLNIAHRSQVMVHRQLQVLDKAERKLEDPDQLELLFQLDHLATQSRRNAENLIILGGERPGRQWRNPVLLHDVVQGAVAETEFYARVEINRLPDISVQGRVVADLVHLIAELVDNATAFSPPESRVEVRGNVVGKGIIVEIEDQGIGLEPEKLEVLNKMLGTRPDFAVMALSDEAQMGLFVVAQLSARHGIKVTLRESAYGGIRALVLLPTSVVVDRADQSDRLDQAGRPELSNPAAETGPQPAVAEGRKTRSKIPRKRQMSGRLEPDVVADPIVPNSPITPRDPIGNNGAAPHSGLARLEPRTNAPAPGESSIPTQSSAVEPKRPAPPQPRWQRPEPADTWQPLSPQAPSAEAGNAGFVTKPSGAVPKPPLPQRKRQANLVAPLREELARANSDGEQKPATSSQRRTPDRFQTNMNAFQKGSRRARAGFANAGPETGLPGGEDA